MCLFSVALFRYLIEQGADIAAVNNDGELAVDIAESDEMEDLLNNVLKEKGQYFNYFHNLIIFCWKGEGVARK